MQVTLLCSRIRNTRTCVTRQQKLYSRFPRRDYLRGMGIDHHSFRDWSVTRSDQSSRSLDLNDTDPAGSG